VDWTALWLSLRLAGWTVVFLLPVAVIAGRALAYRRFPAKGLVEALVMLPLVLPPSVHQLLPLPQKQHPIHQVSRCMRTSEV
jgi:ABC-type molybdate transport system permease subunit